MDRGALGGERVPAAWMEVPLDHEILERVRTVGPIRPLDLEDVGDDQHAVLNRVQMLAGYGLIRKQDETIVITEAGDAYLAGERDGEDFEMDA